MTQFGGHNQKAAKLSGGNVADMRALYKQGGVTQGELSRRYGVSVIQIGRILRGEVWQKVPVEERMLSAGELQEQAERLLRLQEAVAQARAPARAAAETLDELAAMPGVSMEVQARADFFTKGE